MFMMNEDQWEAIIEAMLLFENNIDRLQGAIKQEENKEQRNVYQFLLKRNKKHWEALGKLLREDK
jgi:hypothetical protein